MRRIGTQDGLFIPGNPATQTQGTTVTADWLNALQEELAGAVEGLGGTLDPEDNGQLFAALVAAGLRAATDTAVGVVELATAAEALAGTDALKAITPAALLSGFLGAALGATNGYAVVPVRDAATGVRWDLIVQWGAFSPSATPGEAVPVTFPITFPVACYSLEITVGGYSGTLTQSAWHDSKAATGFNGHSSATSSYACFYLAIGK